MMASRGVDVDMTCGGVFRLKRHHGLGLHMDHTSSTFAMLGRQCGERSRIMKPLAGSTGSLQIPEAVEHGRFPHPGTR